ncbi:MAG: ribosome maturation factor RimM [Terracidiphilus sp.]
MTAPDECTPSEWVGLARIRRPQGRKGEVFADILTDFPEKFTDRRRLWLISADPPAGKLPREVELIHHWLHKGGIVLHFAAIDSISAAETLKGLTVAIPIADRAPLGDDEFYVGDLIGCTLVDVAGPAPVNVGIIDDVDRAAGPTPLLVVRSAKCEVLVPFAKSYLRKIDLDVKKVEMALADGLVDLNVSGKPAG